MLLNLSRQKSLLILKNRVTTDSEKEEETSSDEYSDVETSTEHLNSGLSIQHENAKTYQSYAKMLYNFTNNSVMSAVMVEKTFSNHVNFEFYTIYRSEGRKYACQIKPDVSATKKDICGNMYYKWTIQEEESSKRTTAESINVTSYAILLPFVKCIEQENLVCDSNFFTCIDLQWRVLIEEASLAFPHTK